ncbi:hypothetical protein P9112_000751 [Eukaryota sp. TZLM1-RC]
MDVRPIAVSESIHNIISACCLSRFNEKAKTILLPFQYGINTTDGVSSAIFATDELFRQNESNVCISLDFNNAFNSLSRCSIHGALLQYMPELIPYFQSTYCTYSNLHFGNNILSSSSGVKQGDPLGPLLFCLAIHPILLQIQEMFPSLKMIAYMDDVVLIGDLNIVKQATVCFKELFTKIGLRLNLLKCVLLSNSPVSTIVDGIEFQAKLYSIDAIRHLGSFLGNNDEITNKFPHYRGLGWTKASVLTSCAFIGGCKNAIFEFSERFADWEGSLMATQSSTVFALNEEISKIDVEEWRRCFPQSFNGNIPEKNVLNLNYTLRTLPKRLTGMYEKHLYNNECNWAVLNQDLHSLLLEMGVCENKSSDSSLFVTIVPQRFGLDTVFTIAQTARISCIKEPLLKETLSLNDFGSDDRGDVYCDWIENSETIVDFVSCNVANDTLVHRRKLNPASALGFKAKEKHRKYDKVIEEANAGRNTELVFIAFPFSINGRLSVEPETFLNDFQKMVQQNTMKSFDIFYGVLGFNLPFLIDCLGFSIE